jgi:hypothetical protein
MMRELCFSAASSKQQQTQALSSDKNASQNFESAAGAHASAAYLLDTVT